MSHRRELALLLLLAVAVPACRSERTRLAYGLESGRRLDYVLRLEAHVDQTLSGAQRRQEIRATFEAEQAIGDLLPGGGANATMSLRPRALVVDGHRAASGPGQTFDVVLGPDGRVLSIGQATGEATEALAEVGLERLVPRLRPVLPEGAVVPGDRWTSRTNYTDETGTFSVDVRSRLERLGVVDGLDAALIRSTYRSPVDRTETFANAVADVVGTDLGAQAAWFALDGFLVRAEGDSEGRYRVTFRPPGGEAGLAPVRGSLLVRLHTELQLVRS